MEKFATVQDFEDYALSVLTPRSIDYFSRGAGTGHTAKLNREAFKKIRIRPRALRNVSKRNISTTVLGEKVSMPVGVSPTANHKWAHEDGHCATAKAAESAKTIFVLSAFANNSIQEIAKAAPQAIKWLQTSIHKDRNCTAHFVWRAEQEGFKAIAVTIDSPITCKWKMTNLQPNRLAVFEDYYLSKTSIKDSDEIHQHIKGLIDDSLTWEDITWLKSITKLPIVLKGIMTPEDALLGVKHGASAILVSNQGGRQVDGSPATIEVLPEIVKAVGDKVEVYLDGGIREGTDVFKALALGANMVFMGRPLLWGLACGGEDGARAVLETVRQEVDETFALTGCSSVQQVTKDMVVHASHFYNL